MSHRAPGTDGMVPNHAGAPMGAAADKRHRLEDLDFGATHCDFVMNEARGLRRALPPTVLRALVYSQ